MQRKAPMTGALMQGPFPAERIPERDGGIPAARSMHALAVAMPIPGGRVANHETRRPARHEAKACGSGGEPFDVDRDSAMRVLMECSVSSEHMPRSKKGSMRMR